MILTNEPPETMFTKEQARILKTFKSDDSWTESPFFINWLKRAREINLSPFQYPRLDTLRQK